MWYLVRPRSRPAWPVEWPVAGQIVLLHAGRDFRTVPLNLLPKKVDVLQVALQQKR